MTEDDVETIPITGLAQKAMASMSLRKVQGLMDKAKDINDDLGRMLALDNGVEIGEGDHFRFAQGGDGSLSLLILRADKLKESGESNGRQEENGAEPPKVDAGPLGDN